MLYLFLPKNLNTMKATINLGSDLGSISKNWKVKK